MWKLKIVKSRKKQKTKTNKKTKQSDIWQIPMPQQQLFWHSQAELIKITGMAWAMDGLNFSIPLFSTVD